MKIKIHDLQSCAHHPEPSLTLDDFGSRLVSLCDGRPGLRAGLQVDIREPSEPSPVTCHSSPTLDFIASSETLDRYEEIISANGWRLDNYQRNPVFQNAHQYGDIIFTLGKALLTEVRTIGSRRVLFQRIEFATEVNPMARIAYGLYKGKFLNAVSVGFIPIRWETGSAEAGYRRKFLEQELLEVSAVGIPANPEALQLGLKAGVIEKSDLQELVDLLKSLVEGRGQSSTTPSLQDSITPTLQHSTTPFSDFRSNQVGPNADTGALGVRSDEAQLLQLAREINQLIKRT